MEELRSTEILDKEIQSEARKKADKIIKGAEAESKTLENQVADRVAQAKKEKEEKNAQRLSSFKKNLESETPLEKERFLVSYIQSSIDGGMNEYFSSLSDKEIVSLFANELSKYKKEVSLQSVAAYVYGLDLNLVKTELEKIVKVSSIEKTEFNKKFPEKNYGLENQKGIILETSDKKIRIRLTLSELVSQLEEKYREELYKKLFGGRL